MATKQLSPRELFEALASQYDVVDEQFLKFTLGSPIGKEHKEVLGAFIHESRSLAGKVGRALLRGELPERGKASMQWVYYHRLITRMGIVELILELWKNNSSSL